MGCRTSSMHRAVASIALAVLVVVAGGPMMGMRRSFVVPVAAFLVLSTLTGRARARFRVVAVGTGILAGGALVAWFLISTRSTFPFDTAPWEVVSHWALASDLIRLPAWVYAAGLAVTTAGGLFRARFAVVAAVTAVPFVFLTDPAPGSFEMYPFAACAAAVVLVAVVALARTPLAGKAVEP